MKAPLTLALLETAPDRQTAEIMLVEALHRGVDPDVMKEAWRRWEATRREAMLRGEIA